jgi:protein TonB
MFDDLPISGTERRPTNTRWTWLVSMAGELGVLTLLLVIPMMYVQALPFEWRMMSLMPPPPPSAPPEVLRVVNENPPPVRDPITVPPIIPPHARIIDDSPPAPPGESAATLEVPGAIPGLNDDNRLAAILSSSNPRPPSSAASSRPAALRVGGDLQEAKLIHMVRPKYPDSARRSHVQGMVVLEATIAKDGSVVELRYISGPVLLVPAVQEAVSKWHYQPTLLNGQPVAVQTTIKVIFTLKPAKGAKPRHVLKANPWGIPFDR